MAFVLHNSQGTNRCSGWSDLHNLHTHWPITASAAAANELKKASGESAPPCPFAAQLGYPPPPPSPYLV